MKATMVVLAIMLTVLSAGLAIRYNLNASNALKDLNQERFMRMTAEESLEKSNDKISSIDAELKRTQSKMNGLEKALEQANAFNEDLKSRLNKAAEIKNNLDGKIQELEQMAGGPAPAAAPASPPDTSKSATMK